MKQLAKGSLCTILSILFLSRSDDWRAADGSTLPPPSSASEALFSMSYEYCTEHWCIQESTDSIFTYGAGESFEDINKCDLPYISNIEDNLVNPTQELIDTCGNSVACMVDGLCGDMSDATIALEIEAFINATQDGPVSSFDRKSKTSCSSL